MVVRAMPTASASGSGMVRPQAATRKARLLKLAESYGTVERRGTPRRWDAGGVDLGRPEVDLLGIEGFIGHGLMQLPLRSAGHAWREGPTGLFSEAEDAATQRAMLLRSLERMLHAPEGSHEAISALADVQAIHRACQTDEVCSLAEDLLVIASNGAAPTQSASAAAMARPGQGSVAVERFSGLIQVLFSLLVIASAISSSALLQETAAAARSPMTVQQISSAALYMRL